MTDADIKHIQKCMAELRAFADNYERDLRDLAYINACESDSPNSPDFDNVLNAELFKLGIEE